MDDIPENPPGSSEGAARTPSSEGRPVFELCLDWPSLLRAEGLRVLEDAILPGYLPSCRWFGGKSKTIHATKVVDVIPVSEDPHSARIFLVEVAYGNGSREIYSLPLQITKGDAAREGLPASAVLAWFGNGGSKSALFDGIYDADFRAALFNLIATGAWIEAGKGEVQGIAGAPFRGIVGSPSLESRVLKVEQSNSSVAYEDKLFLKLYRKLETGMNPDAQIIRYLSEKQQFPNVPPFAGSIEYRDKQGDTRVLGLFLGSVRNKGDAWVYALDSLGGFYQRIQAEVPSLDDNAPAPLFGPCPTSPGLLDLIGGEFQERVRQLGHATGGMHLALAAEAQDPEFCPEEFTPGYQRELGEAMRAFVQVTFQVLRQKAPTLADPMVRSEAGRVLDLEEEILRRQSRVEQRQIQASITRTHGDYHLGQVLDTGSDFVIIDFEGEPSRPLAERMLKRSPLRDVAGMIRSFHYAAPVALAQAMGADAKDAGLLEEWGRLWARQVSRLFLDAYLERVSGARFLPENAEDLQVLLESFLIEKAVYEVFYELNNRPAWLPIPFRGILEILGG